MKKSNNASWKKNISRGVLSFALAAGISLAAGTAFADDPTSMAPPIETSAPAGGFNSGTNAAADSVFNWQEIPADQQVPLTRAAFDQGGYQLYDSVGETIIVPFTNENLYVMKFAASPNGSLYFENEGGYPVLYVPQGGYLENATVSGARWYPFGQDFHPTEPVFLGIAPSYPEFLDLGWYPDTHCYGGFYGSTSFISGGVFLPTVGLFFEVGGHSHYGWDGYHRYYEDHPGYFHTDYYNHNFYHYAGSHYSQFAPGRRFGGYSNGFNHGYASGFNHGFNHGYADHSAFAGRSGFSGNSGFSGRSGFGGNSGFSGRTFRGVPNGNGSHNYTVNHSGTANNYGGGGQHFGGQSSGIGGQSSGIGGQSSGIGGQSSGIGGQSSGIGRTFRGASNYGGGQSYNGGSRSYSGGQSYGSGQNYGGSHSFSGSQNGGGQSGSFGGGRENFSRQNSSSQSFGGGRQSFGGSRGGFGGSRGSNSSGGGSRGGNSGGNQGGGGNRGGGGGGRSR